jgi:nitroimidazol reductase NimA-like FMN-containing flavoprotein (pyridoxamine 5'-phosphate oxidase superfamily)
MKVTGPWSIEVVHAHLEAAAIPLRLAHATRTGHPQVMSLWFVRRDAALWCATAPRARIVAMLEREPRCGFEVAGDAPPYRGVRGRAIATIDRSRGAEILEALVDRYLGTRETPFARWLLARADRETAIALEPRSVTSWDYRERMSAG